MVGWRAAILVSPLVGTANGLAADSTVRWASSGGGWRAMVSNFGYTHAFQKAGLITENDSLFTGASFNSGASWYAAQLFYSQAFFDKLVGADINEDNVYNFSKSWLDGYGEYLDSKGVFFCDALSAFGLLSLLGLLSDACNFLTRTSWYEFIRDMLGYAAENVYGDNGLQDRVMDSTSRVSALGNTNLMFQMGLSESSRYGDILKRYSFVSTDGADRTLAVPVPVQYAVTDTGTSFRYGLDEGQTLVTMHTKGRSWFFFSDWNDWYSYPASIGGSDIYSQRSVDTSTVQPFTVPFNNNGKATVAQITASSSANLASFSGSVPVFLFHHYSMFLADQGSNIIGSIRVYAEVMGSYFFPSFFNNAVCTQSPNKCGAADGRFIDGGFIDGPSLAQNIGHHHSVENGNLNNKLKIILTNNNYKFDANTKLLAYFSTSFNEGVAPGAFLWAPFTVPDYRSRQETPWRSPQIFSDPMDDTILEAAFVQIPGTELTTAEYTLTTLENPAFGVKQGQTVELLLLQINTEIEVNFLLKTFLEADKENLAQLARTIAGSEELVTRIQTFLEK